MTTVPQQPNAPGNAWQPVPTRSQSTLVFEVLGIALGLVGVVALTTEILGGFGSGATAIAAVLAFVPLLGVLLAVRWIDRWEPEPRSMMILALVWGAGVAAFSSYLLNTVISTSIHTGQDPMREMMISSAAVAPIVEEFTKGLVLLLILWIRPRAIDGVVDGIVYAALSAAGFAFTENILYFARFSDTLLDTFVARALMGPFAHVSFSLMMGIAIGLAARHRNRWAWTWLFPIGFLLAVALHSLWNYSTFSGRFDTLYWFLQLPIFLALAYSVVVLRREEAKMIRRRAGEFASAGWLTQQEAHMLGSFEERGRAVSWAKRMGREDAMRDMQRTATRLVYNRERAVSGRAEPLDFADQNRLLHELTAQRAALYGTPALS